MIADMKPLWIIDLRTNRAGRLETWLNHINECGERKWVYTHFDTTFVANSIETFRKIQDQLTAEAQKQINKLLSQNGLNSHTLHICVLGDITSAQSRSLLPFLAVMLRRNWQKVLPNHVSMGIAIGTLCHIPTDINQHTQEKQRDYALFLEELSFLHQNIGGETYDYMVIYGDIQPIGKQTFTTLDSNGKEELIYQYLLNIYDTGTDSRLSAFSSGSSHLFCNMGATSCFYDTEYMRQRTAKEIVDKLLQLFRQKQEEDSLQPEFGNDMQHDRQSLIETCFLPQFLSGQNLLRTVSCNDADITADLNKTDNKCRLHPIRDFWKPMLYPAYYLDYLRHLPAQLNEYLHFYTNSLQKLIEQRMQHNREKAFGNTCQTIDSMLDEFWNNPQYHYKTLSEAETLLHTLTSLAETEQNKLKESINASDISPIHIPDFLASHVKEIELSGTNNDFQRVLKKLKATLEKEPTFLGSMVRCLLIGITGIFCILPLLEFLSPDIINIGNVEEHRTLWKSIIFISPFLLSLWWGFSRHFRLIKKLKNRLWTYSLLQLQEHLTVPLMEEARNYYEKVKQYCEQKLAEYERLRNSCKASFEITSQKYIETLFNHSIDEFIKDKSLLDEKIKIDQVQANVGQLTEKQLYQLLASVIISKEADFVSEIPEDEQTLQQKVQKEINRLFSNIQKRIVLPIHTNIQSLCEKCFSLADWKTICEQAFPVGIFADNTSHNEVCILRISSPITLNMETANIKQEIDTEGNPFMLFVTECQYMDSLLLSQFLSETTFDYYTDYRTELTCYYTFYDHELKRGAKFRNVSIGYERLHTIDQILND